MCVCVCIYLIAMLFYPGIHTLDWQTAPSVLWNTLANKQVERSGYGDGKVLRKKREASSDQLEIVSLVAAPVINSLLLRSGDVEKNPGPGGSADDSLHEYTACIVVIDNVLTSYTDLDYNSVDTAQTLSRLS